MSRQGQATLPFAVAKSASDGPVKPSASVVLSKSSTGPIAPEVVDVSRTSPVLQSSSTIPFPAPAESGAIDLRIFPARSSPLIIACLAVYRPEFIWPTVGYQPKGKEQVSAPKASVIAFVEV